MPADPYVEWMARRILGLAERKFNPAQPRDPGGEGGGQWIKGVGGIVNALQKLIDTYGPIEDEWEPTSDSLIAIHDNGDISVSFGGDTVSDREVWGDFSTPSDAQFLADRVADFEADVTSYDGSPPPSPNGLVDWTVSSGSDDGAEILVGFTADGEIAIGWPGRDADPLGNDLSGYHMRYLIGDEAVDFANFLGSAAEVSDEIQAGDRSSRRPLASRGRRRAG